MIMGTAKLRAVLPHEKASVVGDDAERADLDAGVGSASGGQEAELGL